MLQQREHVASLTLLHDQMAMISCPQDKVLSKCYWPSGIFKCKSNNNRKILDPRESTILSPQSRLNRIQSKVLTIFNGSAQGSGFAIAEDVILTCGHVIENPDADSVILVPAQKGTGSGSSLWFRAKTVFVNHSKVWWVSFRTKGKKCMSSGLTSFTYCVYFDLD